MTGQALSVADLDVYEFGTGVLGSGGGGPSPIGLSLVRHALRAAPLPRLVDLGALPPDAPLVPVGIYGSTGTLREMPPSGHEFPRVLAEVEASSGVRPRALLGMEVAGLNGAMLVFAAMTTGLDLVDADLMGRALPRLDQLSFAIDGVPLSPTVVVTATGSSILVKEADPAATERVLRGYLQEAGGWAAIGFAPVTAADVRRSAVRGGIAHALTIGRTLRGAGPERLDAAVRSLGGRVLARGRIDEMVWRSVGRPFPRGSAGLRDREGARVRIEMENEYVVVLRDGEPVATAPDLICLVDHPGGRPVGCDAVRAGQAVAVLQLPGTEFWRAESRSSAVGPRAFGIAVDPVPHGTGW